MSNIYIQEPPTKGKVILKTTVGEIEVELWSKECPKTCRNFVQLCMEGYYNGTIFHRILKDFIAQGGDPTGTGEGGDSIYGEPFKDEFHSRLRFNRRGLLGMANSQLDDNASQFFFTLGACPELNKKHTLFGRVGGTTIYNMIKLNESELIDERPVRPERILSAEIIYNPFEDIQPRNLRATKQVVVETKKQKGVKNFGLLSFGDEAEEDEEELGDVTETLKTKAKSAHDVGDPSLISKQIDKNKNNSDSSSSSSESDGSDSDKEKAKKVNVDLESIKSKLQKKSDSLKKSAMNLNTKNSEKVDEKEVMRKKTQDEIKKIQKELSNKDKDDTKKKEEIEEKKEEGKIVKEYKEDVEKYEHLRNRKKNEKKKEDKTLELLNLFRDRLFKAKKIDEDTDEPKAAEEESEPKKSDENEENEVSKESIWTHRLEVEDEIKQKVIDANVADNDRWDIYDPRNPLNKRKREESKDILKDRKRSGTGSSRSSYSSSRSRHH